MKYKNLTELVVEYIITRSLCELSQLTRYKIAEHFDVNKNYLSERFKKKLQITVFKFVLFEKMKRAECLLKKRYDQTVGEISKKVGIEDVKQFRKRFQEAYGLKPGLYRSLFKARYERIRKREPVKG